MSTTLTLPKRQPVHHRRRERRAALKVLSIDDDPNVTSAISRELARRQIVPLEALHGMQGYWLACTERPDVIILDLAMPRGDGAYVVECLRQNAITREIPIIILSGSNDPRLWNQVRESMVDAILYKPASFSKLYRVIQSLT